MQSHQAFTLAEVMMATVVTLVAVVGLISAVTMGSEMLDVARKQTVAMQIIRNEIDSIHLRSWAMVRDTLPASATVTINDNGTDFSAGNATDKQAFALTNYSAAPANYNLGLMGVAKGFTVSMTKSLTAQTELFAITYTVTWNGGNMRKGYSRSSMTYYGKTGLNLYYQK